MKPRAPVPLRSVTAGPQRRITIAARAAVSAVGRLRLAAVIAGVAAIAALTACEDASQAPQTSDSAAAVAATGDDRKQAGARVDGAPAERIVARTNESELSVAEVEPGIARRLYDLEVQQYRLLREATEAAVLERIDASRGPPIAELTLVPPEPPRLAVSADPSRLRIPGGKTQVPVTIVVFCNFESPHCARLQATLDVLESLFPGLIATGSRDLILPFHRNAGLAALAGRCAAEQDRYWAFHNALYATGGTLDRARIDSAAAMANLSPAPLAQCIDSQRWAAQIEDDLATAAELGLDTVPTVFVNGLYAGLEPPASDLIWIVEHELARLGIESPLAREPDRLSLSRLRILALLHSAEPGQGLALVEAVGSGAVRTLREGDRIDATITLGRITGLGLYLRNAGTAELLPFDADEARLSVTAADSQAPVAALRAAVPVVLDRNEVRVRLTDRSGLAQSLEPVEMRAGDYRLLRVREVSPGSLYALLGLEAGDVILGVNEQTVHEADNPLWRALEQNQEVRLTVMRSGGIPQHFTYRFDE